MMNDELRMKNVEHPGHYKQFKTEVIDVIRGCLSDEEFKGYLKGNIIKYRLRAGWKGYEKRDEDLQKSNKYQDWLFALEVKDGLGDKGKD